MASTVARAALAPLRAAKRSVRAKAAGFSPSAPEDRPLWLPGSEPPAHLDGSMPGDYGFDPLNLGNDAELLTWFQQAELQHCRWAMLGVAGCLVPEVLNGATGSSLPIWSEAGATKFDFDLALIFWMQMFMMNWAEVRRWQDIRAPGSVSEDPLFKGNKCTGTDVGYPGGRWFDPFGMGAGDNVKELRTKEIKNGRLAMVAFVGFSVQAFATGKGPVACWTSHLADPTHTTIMQAFGN